jgi:26S proteasome regulatory complex component, contains PCI domain
MSIKPDSSKAAIITSVVIGKISSIVGYAFAFIFGLPLIMGAFHEVGAAIVAIVFIAISVALILNGIKIKKRNRRFKKYVGLISVENQTSLENIASSTMQSLDFVTRDIQKMIDKKFFLNAYIDKETNEIVLQRRNTEGKFAPAAANAPVEMITVTCKGCGAVNSIPKGSVAECEFCGSPLK